MLGKGIFEEQMVVNFFNGEKHIDTRNSMNS